MVAEQLEDLRQVVVYKRGERVLPHIGTQVELFVFVFVAHSVQHFFWVSFVRVDVVIEVLPVYYFSLRCLRESVSLVVFFVKCLIDCTDCVRFSTEQRVSDFFDLSGLCFSFIKLRID